MKPRGKPFERGNNANPSGRPKGSRSKATAALDAILDGDAEAILRKATEMAKGGDTVAIRLCLDRLVPPRRDRIVTFQLPPLETAEDATKAMAALVDAVASGELTPGEAGDLSKLVADFGKVMEVGELAQRLIRMEVALQSGPARIAR